MISSGTRTVGTAPLRPRGRRERAETDGTRRWVQCWTASMARQTFSGVKGVVKRRAPVAL